MQFYSPDLHFSRKLWASPSVLNFLGSSAFKTLPSPRSKNAAILKEDVLEKSKEVGFFDKDYAGKSEIDDKMIAGMDTETLQAVLALEGDDLHKKDKKLTIVATDLDIIFYDEISDVKIVNEGSTTTSAAILALPVIVPFAISLHE